MKNKVFIATCMVEWSMITPLLEGKYGKKVKIELARAKGLEELKIFINQNKYRGPSFIVEGEYGVEVEARLMESGLKFGMFQKDPETKNWTIRIYNKIASEVLASIGR